MIKKSLWNLLSVTWLLEEIPHFSYRLSEKIILLNLIQKSDFSLWFIFVILIFISIEERENNTLIKVIYSMTATMRIAK